MMMRFGNLFLGRFRMFMYLTFVWILLPREAKCQECSPSGLEVYRGYYYVFYHATYRNFQDTREFCQSLGGDMPVITSEDQNNFIAKRLERDNSGHYNIGFEDGDNDGEYVWINGITNLDHVDNRFTYWENSLYPYAYWKRIYPPYCAVMRSSKNLDDAINGRWNRVACSSSRRHICQIPVEKECRWQEFGESQYLIKFILYSTPDSARGACQSYGGDLAIIKTKKINNFLKEQLPQNQDGASFCYYFGLRVNQQGHITWLDGATVNPNPVPNMPNDRGSWGCLLRDDPSWQVLDPKQPRPSICERTRSFDNIHVISFRGIDYFISPSWMTRSFSDARTYCHYHGGDLALIKSLDVNTFLHDNSSEFNISGRDRLLFGLTKQAGNNTFKWIDGTPLGYSSPWKSDEPNTARSKRDCASIDPSDSNKEWISVSCNTKYRFICEYYKDVPEYKWSELDGSFYYISQSSRTSYSFARKFCQDQGGDLAQPKTERVNAHLKQLADGNSYWFGLDVDQESNFQWVDGTPLADNQFPTWSNGNATVFENERCVHQQNRNGWRKLPCTSYLMFACEKLLILPYYNGTPELIKLGYFHAEIQWRLWDPRWDTGNGPVIAYKIYVRHVRSGTREIHVYNITLVAVQDVQPQQMADWSECSARKCTHNVTELVPGTNYSVQIAAIRKGIKGEGGEGPPLTFTTESLPVTSTISCTSHVSTTKMIASIASTFDPGAQSNSFMALVAGGIVGIIIVILIIIIVFILFKQRRQIIPSKTANIEDQETANEFEETSFDGDNSGKVTASSPNKPTPRSTGTKPAVAAKPGRRELADAAHHVQGPHNEQSETKPLKRQPIPTSEFPVFVSTNRYTALFSDEFHDLPDADIYPQTVAREEINHKKNRYKNILPYDSARVKLEVINGDPNSDYFNASYIPNSDNDKAYIASQGPNNASMDDFWRMVWQEKVNTIAMVTKLREGDKVKCGQYWPNKPGDLKMFGNIKVEFGSQNPCTGGVKREMTMKVGKEKRIVTQFHFRVWPDKGVPKHTSLLLKFIKEVKTNHGHNPHPLVIHCSAGVGRTGVVISIDSIAAHAKRTRTVDVSSFVTKIRQNRPFMVQTQEQYAFIYGAVLEDLLWRNTLVPIIHFSDHLQDLHSVDDSGKSKMTKEFETLKTLCPDPPVSQTSSGRTQENHHKNRYGNNLPLQRNRVILDSPHNDYINASYVRGVHCTFMTTQMPMPSTVSDFCRMVLNKHPSTIVMLNDQDQDDKSCAQYWSDDGTAEFGSYRVSTLSTSSDDDMITRQLKISNNSKSCHTVTQYQFVEWQKHGSNQQSKASSLLKLIRAVKSAIKNESEFSLLVHCLSGVGRTGVFCSAMECIAQMEESDSVDIFQTVKILRADRMQFVQTEEDYTFIYDVIRAYLHKENYEQLPYPLEDHTYDNLDADDYCNFDRQENAYEVADPQAAGKGLVYSNVESAKGTRSQKPQPQSSQTVYENFEFES